MSFAERQGAIVRLEQGFGAPILTYITGDTLNSVGTKIGQDALRLFYRHLANLGHVDRLGLLLYTRGGDTLATWRIVTLLREFCKELHVLIPYRCHSAGTLIALGADQIWMGPMGELSPVDPSVTNEFNPADAASQAKVPISVEDVTAFFKLLQAQMLGEETDVWETPWDLSEDTLLQAFRVLAEHVHPLALGNIQRSHSQIRQLTHKLLGLHMENQATVDSIVNTLTEKLFTHGHLIGRVEGKEIKLPISDPSKAVEALMWRVFELYETQMRIGMIVDPVPVPPGQPYVDWDLELAAIETSHTSDVFRIRHRFLPTVEGQPTQVILLDQRWHKVA